MMIKQSKIISAFTYKYLYIVNSKINVLNIKKGNNNSC